MIVRRMRPADIETIIGIGKACKEFDVSESLDGFWSREALLSWCRSRKDLMLIAEVEGALVGFAFFACHAPTGKVTLENLWVDSARRGQGVAQKLIERAIGELERRGCRFIVALTGSDNRAAANFLGRNGFKPGKNLLWMDRTLR